MSTVAQLIDRAMREFLYPPDEQPIRFTLGAAITTTSATTFSVNTDLLSPEEEALLGPGTIVEFDRELVQIGAYDESLSTDQATSCLRGVGNTTAATHLIDAPGIVWPKFPRQNVYDAICDEVELLWPDLSKVSETASMTFSSTSYTEVAATVMKPMYAWARPSGTDDWAEYDVRFYDHFPASSTGKAVSLDGLADSVAGYLVYRGKFTRPSAESTDLVATCGLEDEWERIVLLGAVAYLIAGKDLSPMQSQFLSEQLANQNFQVGSGARIWSALRSFRQDLLDKAQKAQHGREKTTVVRRTVY
jgi:hypothetical protein